MKYIFCGAVSVALAILIVALGFYSWQRVEPDQGQVVSKSNPPEIADPYYVELTGSKAGWSVRYPGLSGQKSLSKSITSNEQILVPINTTVVLTLKSTDYVYLLSIPQFGVKEVAVPKLEFAMRFRSTTSGRFELVGNELCGDPHVEMPSSLVILPQRRFANWLNKRS